MNNAIRHRGVAALAAVLGLVVARTATAEVQATDAWALATAPGAKVGAVYLTLANPGDEERKLLKIVTPVSDAITIHQTSVTGQGTVRMWPMAVLAVDAGQTVRLQPGGLHIMLTDLKSTLVAGQKIPVTMKFDGGEPEFTLMVEVRPVTAAADTHRH
jgi:copper(I)-binding protein